MRRRRRVFFIASGRARLDPVRDLGQLLPAKRRIIRKVAAAGVSEPGRHLVILNRLQNLLRPGLGLLIGDQGKWSNLAGAMTRLAMLLEDRQHIFVKSWRRLRSGSS